MYLGLTSRLEEWILNTLHRRLGRTAQDIHVRDIVAPQLGTNSPQVNAHFSVAQGLPSLRLVNLQKRSNHRDYGSVYVHIPHFYPVFGSVGSAAPGCLWSAHCSTVHNQAICSLVRTARSIYIHTNLGISFNGGGIDCGGVRVRGCLPRSLHIPLFEVILSVEA